MTTNPAPDPNLAIAAALACLALAACGRADAPSTSTVDSAGVAIVTSTAADATLPWTTTPRFTLGGEPEGPESFYQLPPARLGADDAGRIHVLNAVDHRVVVFGPDGDFERALGREGRGPGELSRPAMLHVAGDGTVSVYDYGKGALVRWDAAGQALPERPFPHRPMIGGRFHAPLDDGYVVSTGGLDESGERANRLLRIAGGDTTVLASLPQPGRESAAMFESCGGGINFPPLFTPHAVWDRRDGVTAVVPGGDYRIDLYRDGALARSIRRPIPATPATRELAIAEAGDGFRIDFGRGPCVVPPDEYADARGWTETVPAIADVLLAPGGELWVQRRLPGEDHPPIDLFTRDGAYRGTLPPGTLFPALLLPDGAVGVIVTDDDDVDRLVVEELRGLVRHRN